MEPTNVDSKNMLVGRTAEEKKLLYDQLAETSGMLNKNMSLILYQAQEQKKVKEKYLEILSIDDKLKEEHKLTKQAILLLKGWYNKSKDLAINRLQERINIVLGDFFKSDYSLKLVQGVERGHNVVNLVAVGNDGREIGTIEIMLSGAEQQLSGFLIQVATTSGESQGIMVLDEAFSSFGVKEVALLPEILSASDKQMIIIEHKDELFEDFDIPTIELDRNDEIGTYISSILNMEKQHV